MPPDSVTEENRTNDDTPESEGGGAAIRSRHGGSRVHTGGSPGLLYAGEPAAAEHDGACRARPVEAAETAERWTVRCASADRSRRSWRPISYGGGTYLNVANPGRAASEHRFSALIERALNLAAIAIRLEDAYLRARGRAGATNSIECSKRTSRSHWREPTWPSRHCGWRPQEVAIEIASEQFARAQRRTQQLAELLSNPLHQTRTRDPPPNATTDKGGETALDYRRSLPVRGKPLLPFQFGAAA